MRRCVFLLVFSVLYSVSTGYAQTISFQKTSDLLTGDGPGGVKAADLNGDGLLDLAVHNQGSAEVSVFLGTGGGSFGPAVHFSTGAQVAGFFSDSSLEIADLNLDGLPDLAVTNTGAGSIAILKNMGGASFSLVQTINVGAGPISIAAGNFNQDNFPDLAVAAFGGFVTIHLGIGNGTFSTPTFFNAGFDPIAIVIADFDENGHVDLAVADAALNEVSVFVGDGNGSFTPAGGSSVGRSPLSLKTGDVNSDGHLDLLTANINSQDVSILLGAGNGQFSPGGSIFAGLGPRSIVLSDLNNDGHTDLAIAAENQSIVFFYQGLGNGLFSFPGWVVISGPAALATADLNGDGRVDLAVSRPTHDTLSILLNTTAPAPNNQPPTANAGLDQTVHQGALVTLDGSGSSDPDANYPLTYVWTIASKPAGSAAALANPTLANPTFTADRLGDYVIQLVVTDSLGAASTGDTVKVSTFNTAPIADAGPDQAITTIGTLVQLDGSQSYDLDGDSFTYSWTLTSKPAGSAAVLSDPASAMPTFVADVHGDYGISLVVTDVFGAVSAPDTVLVSFTNVPPVANAGVNQSVLAGDTVFLDGSSSSDANLDPLTYSWSIVSKPAGSTAVLSNPTSAQSSFVADLPGTYVVSLVVNDGFVNSSPSNVTIGAISVQNAITQTLQELIATINALDGSLFKNANMKNALTNKINAVLGMVDQGQYSQALDKLQNDILPKTDGCATAGAPDANDWITTCGAQNQVYPLIIQAIDLLKRLI